MPGPSSTAFLRPDLGRSFDEWDVMAALNGYIGLQVLPRLDVSLSAGQFGVRPLEAYTKTRHTLRAPSSSYARQDWEFEQVSWSCQERGAEDVIDDRQRAAFAFTGLDFDQTAAWRVMITLMRELEEAIAAVLEGSGNTTGVGTAWDAGGDPIADVNDAIDTFIGQCGIHPSHCVLSDKLLRKLQSNAAIVDRIKHHGNGPAQDARRVTANALSEIWRLNVLVADAPSNVKDSAGEGLAASLTQIWDPTKLGLFLQTPTGDPLGPGLGLTFHFVEDGSSMGPTMEQYREESIRSDVIRGRLDYDVVEINAACAHVLTGVST